MTKGMKKLLSPILLISLLVGLMLVLTTTFSLAESEADKKAVNGVENSSDESTEVNDQISEDEEIQLEKVAKEAKNVVSDDEDYIRLSSPAPNSIHYIGDYIYFKFQCYDTWQSYYTTPTIVITDSSGDIIDSLKSNTVVSVNAWSSFNWKMELSSYDYSPGTYYVYLFNIPSSSSGTYVDGWSDWDVPAVRVPISVRRNTSPLGVKSLWASKHMTGKVLFKWSAKDNRAPKGWRIKYRTRVIGGSGSWGYWKYGSTAGDVMQAEISVWTNSPNGAVVEVHAQAEGDSTWSTGIITCPAGCKYQAMKTTHVYNVAAKKRFAERTVSGSAVKHITINMKVGQKLKVKPSYDYPVKNYVSRPRLYPTHMLYDIGNKSMISIYKPNGAKYSGGIIDGTATIKATKRGKTTIIFRSPNGRTVIGDVTIR